MSQLTTQNPLNRATSLPSWRPLGWRSAPTRAQRRSAESLKPKRIEAPEINGHRKTISPSWCYLCLLQMSIFWRCNFPNFACSMKLRMSPCSQAADNEGRIAGLPAVPVVDQWWQERSKACDVATPTATLKIGHPPQSCDQAFKKWRWPTKVLAPHRGSRVDGLPFCRAQFHVDPNNTKLMEPV